MGKSRKEFEELQQLRDWTKHMDEYDLNTVQSQMPQPVLESYAANNRKIFAEFGEQERMLADKPRMAFYREMIRRHISTADRVIDLGTGTGILAAFASWQGAAKIYAIDHSDIIEQAKMLARHNGIKNVEFHSINSTLFELPERVDVILHEQMGDVLFDEEMVDNVIDLRNRLLKEGGRIWPARFELYCEPVQIRDKRAVPFIWELNIEGFDFSPLKNQQAQNADYYSYSEIDNSLVDHFLCDPIPLLSFDLNTLQKGELPLEITLASEVLNDGRMDGYTVYFKALVDDDLVLSTSPLDKDRAPHWGFRVLRTEQIQVKKGDILDITIGSENWPDIYSWHWAQARYSAGEYRDCMTFSEDENDE